MPPAEPDTELRAKDLIRRGELSKRAVVGDRTVKVLFSRAAWRPCGNSAKLWAKVGEVDPFATPLEVIKPEHRNVYAHGRFVRIDQADKAAGRSPQDKIREKVAPKPAKADGAEAPARPAIPKWADKNAEHTPLFGRKPENPLKKPAVPTPPPEGFDRTPPIVRPTAASTTSSGRVRSAPTTGPRRPVVGGPAPGGEAQIVPNTPPKQVVRTPAAAAGRQGELTRRPPPKVTGPIDRTPPIIRPGQVPAKAPAPFSEGAAMPAPKPPAAPKSLPTPPAPRPPAPAAAPQPKAMAPQPAQPRPAPTQPQPVAAATSEPARPPVARPAAAEQPAAPPPDIKPPGAVLNTMSAPQVVPRRKAVQPAPEPVAEPAKAPAKPGPPPSMGGMDDLFGGGAQQEGRVRLGRVKKDPT